MKPILLSLFLCVLCAPLCAQTDSTAVPAQDSLVQFGGMILDNETGEELPYIEVRFDSLQKGTRSNKLGLFEIKLPPGTHVLRIETLGYDDYRDTITIVPGSTPDRQMIMLPPKSHEIEGTTIQYVNPAIRIMKLAIKHRKDNRLSGMDSYALRSYTKTALFFDNVSDEKLNNFMLRSSKDFVNAHKGDSALMGQDGKMELMLFMSELIEDQYFRAPRDEKRIVLGEQSRGVDNLEFGAITRMLLQMSIYDPVMEILDKQFISPLNPTAFLSYKFAKMDQRVAGTDTTFKIELRPRNKFDFSFVGHIWVENKTWAVTDVDIKTVGNTDFNFVDNVELQERFINKDGHWLPNMRQARVDFKNKDKNVGLVGNAVEYLYNYRIDTTLSDELFKGLEVELQKGAESRDSTYWDSIRGVELSAQEKLGYDLIESNQKKLFWKVFNGLTELFSTGGKRVGRNDQFVIGPYGQLIGFNPIEGWRTYFGWWSHKSMHPRFNFRTELGYGLRDRRLKYLGMLSYVPILYPRTEIGIQHAYKMEQAGFSSFENSGGTGAVASVLQRIPLFNLNYYRESKFWAKIDIIPNLAVRGFARHKTFEPGFDFAFRDGDALRRRYQFAEFGGRLRIAFKQDYLLKYGEKVYLDSPYPVFFLEYSKGVSGVFGSDFNYDHLAFTISDRILLGRFGWMTLTAKIGKIWGTLPYPMLYVFEGSQSWEMGRLGWSAGGIKSMAGTFNRTETYEDVRYNLMYFYEFIADQYLSVGFDHHFDGYFLRKIPLIRKLKWRSVFTYRLGLGSLREENRRINTFNADDAIFDGNDNINAFNQFVQAPTRPYMEIGVGVENIFKLIRLDYIWRLSYRNPRTTEAAEGYLLNHGPRLTISLSL